MINYDIANRTYHHTLKNSESESRKFNLPLNLWTLIFTGGEDFL